MAMGVNVIVVVTHLRYGRNQFTRKRVCWKWFFKSKKTELWSV